MSPDVVATIRYRLAPGQWRRVQFRERADGRYRREVHEWTGCRWRPEGSEIVEDLHLADHRDTAPA